MASVTTDMSILSLIAGASILVKGVMLLLAAVSFMSWYWIFRKWFAIRDARIKTDQFERDFWSGGDLNSLYQSAVNDRHSAGALERIFEAGYREFTKLRGQKSLDPATVVDGARRAMRATYQREMDHLEAHLAFLASVGSVSPYVGLFGTVWGIYHALIAIGVSGQGTLDKVAGPVGEALIMTGLGLAVAIPAALAYNFFVRHTRNTMTELNGFAHDVFALLVIGIKRQADAGLPAKADGAVTPLTWARKQPAQAAH